MAARACRDCDGTTKRPAPWPGPRCASHHRERTAEVADRAWARRLAKEYDITPVEYWRIYDAQGGKCAICQWATGKRKRLAVDHDHSSGLVRGLLCGSCNRELLGRYGQESLERALAYLDDPPAPKTIGRRIVPEGGKSDHVPTADPSVEI